MARRYIKKVVNALVLKVAKLENFVAELFTFFEAFLLRSRNKFYVLKFGPVIE